jgi:hypothetical protein
MAILSKLFSFTLYLLAFILGGSALFYSIKGGRLVISVILWTFTVLSLLAASFISWTADD